MSSASQSTYDAMSGPSNGIHKKPANQPRPEEIKLYNSTTTSYKKYLQKWHGHSLQYNLQITRGLCVNPISKCIFYKPGRTMGSYLFGKSLSRYGGWLTQKKNKRQKLENERAESKGTYYEGGFNQWLSVITDDEIKNYTKCIIVRNPFGRLVSTYNAYTKMRFFERQKDEGEKSRFRKWRPSDSMSFDEYVDTYYQDISSPSPDIHSLPFHKFFTSGYSIDGNPDYWGKMENIEEDWPKLLKAFDINNISKWPEQPERVKVPGLKSGYNPFSYRKYYTPRTREIIGNYYKVDLDYFNYDF